VGMFIIERGEEEILPMENEEALGVLLKNCEDAYGFPPYEDIKEFLYMRNGVDLREKEHEIIYSALGNKPVSLIRSSSLDWWCRIPAFVNDKLADDCACDEGSKKRSVQREPVMM